MNQQGLLFYREIPTEFCCAQAGRPGPRSRAGSDPAVILDSGAYSCATDPADGTPLPPKPAGALAFHYPRSEGFVYEARAVHAALRAGKTALDEWTHAESLTTQAIVDAMRAAVVSA